MANNMDCQAVLEWFNTQGEGNITMLMYCDYGYRMFMFRLAFLFAVFIVFFVVLFLWIVRKLGLSKNLKSLGKIFNINVNMDR